ncbi:MAG: FtsX-like permease family protein [Solirubrobacteraceae bacterium]
MLLIARLATADIKRRRAQSALLLLMIATTTTTLALGLVLHGITDRPFAHTRAATRGPDVVAELGLPGPVSGATSRPLEQAAALARARGVAGATGPYPLAFVTLAVRGRNALVSAEGRDLDPVGIDQPLVTHGGWVRAGGAVIEQGLAQALGVHVGDTIRLDGRSFAVVGLALTTAQPAYPGSLPGLVWLTRAATERLAVRSQPLSYVLNLKLVHPASAPAFAGAHFTNPTSSVIAWQQIRSADTKVVAVKRRVLLVSSWLLAMLAAASIAVLVGGRMEQTRRIGLLKAVGATPRLVAAILLAENLLLALAAAAVGLAAGRLLAPLITDPGSGMLGSAGSPSLTITSIVVVGLSAVAVAAAATIAPAIRGARTSAIRALNDPARPPRRSARMIELSGRVPVPLLLGLRLIARRPRRTLLSGASLTIAVAIIVAALTLEHHTSQLNTSGGLPGTLPGSSVTDQITHVVFILSATLLVLAGISAIFITWSTVIDAQRPTALARALGATPPQVSAGLTAAQLLPALAAGCLGIPVGLSLYALVGGGGAVADAPALALLAVIPGTLIVVAGLTAVPARIGARRSVAVILRAE